MSVCLLRIILITLLHAFTFALKVNYIFLGMDDTAAYVHHLTGYINPAVLNVTFETVRQMYPEVVSEMRVIPLITNDTNNIGADPCDIAIRSFPLFAELYGRQPELFKPISREQITVVAAGDFCVDPNPDLGYFSAEYVNVPMIALISPSYATDCTSCQFGLLHRSKEPDVCFSYWRFLAADFIFLSSNLVSELSNITVLPNTINLYNTPSSNMFGTLKAIMTLNNWNVFGVLCGEDDLMYYWDCLNGFQWYFWDNQFEASSAYRPKLNTSYLEMNAMEILLDIKLHVRVIFIMALPKLLRRILIAAYKANMTNGDFVFIAADRQPTFNTPDLLHWKAVTNDSYENDMDDHKAFAAFKCTLLISDLGINWENLENFTKQSAELSEVMLNRTIPLQGQRDITSVLFLEVLLIFAQGLERLLPDLDTITPSEFIKDLLNHTYSLPSREIAFFPNGKNVLSTPILRLNSSTGKFETAATCKYDNSLISILRPSLWAWFGDGRFPPDEPFCGFDGNGCQAMAIEIIAPLAVVALLLCVTFVTGYVIRRRAEDRVFSAILLESAESRIMLDGSLLVPLGTSTSKFSVTYNAKFRAVILDVLRVSHPNIGHFYGINVTKESLSLVWEFGDRGNVNEIICSRPVLRDDAILLSLLWDLLQGLIYIQSSVLQFHGTLSPAVCFVNHRYSLKVAKMGCFHLLECLGNKQEKLFSSMREKTAYYRSEDVRDFGVISQTLLAHKKSEIAHIEAGHKPLTYDKWTRLTRQCLLEDPAARPSVTQVKKQFGQLRLPKNIVDYVIRMMDEQNRQLEAIVLEKTKSLVEERHNVDHLLAEILPRSIVHKLRIQEETSPETFDSVSVLFSDIPGFSNLLSSCSPWDIISLLNNAYSEFDSIFGLYDAYKVETINDSYMLASGVPTRNGTQHATELCQLALHLLSTADTCLASYELTARIGINSGPVVAGVIGSKMPRYCLFGDTVNTASRMETSGEVGKIHVNESAQNLAESGKGLVFVPRGLITIKGKGEMKTFWLKSSTDEMQANTKMDGQRNTLINKPNYVT